MIKHTDMTDDELIEALREALEAAQEDGNEPGTITTREFQEALGLGEDATRARLRLLYQEGLITPDRVRRVNMWGETQRIKGWRYAA